MLLRIWNIYVSYLHQNAYEILWHWCSNDYLLELQFDHLNVLLRLWGLIGCACGIIQYICGTFLRRKIHTTVRVWLYIPYKFHCSPLHFSIVQVLFTWGFFNYNIIQLCASFLFPYPFLCNVYCLYVHIECLCIRLSCILCACLVLE